MMMMMVRPAIKLQFLSTSYYWQSAFPCHTLWVWAFPLKIISYKPGEKKVSYIFLESFSLWIPLVVCICPMHLSWKCPLGPCLHLASLHQPQA